VIDRNHLKIAAK